jgi:trans-2,3-dihydro-3-hydroxyanthranilate isomerase
MLRDDVLRYDVVDVFAERAFAGNPLAVVHGADLLDSAQLAAIAREFNLSETVFPLPPSQPGASYRARIFTPCEELPFAGHPSVGVAWVLAREGVIGHGEAVQECGAGLLGVRVDAEGARISGGMPSVGAELNAAALAETVGLTSTDVDPVAAAGVASAGLEHVFLPVRAGALARARLPELAALRAATGGRGMINLVALDLAAGRVRSRMFGPGVGVAEDPATGSAALALAVFAVDRGLLPGDGGAAFTIHQGVEMGRPSVLEVEVSTSAGGVSATSVRGRVIEVAAGQIAVPPPTP